MREGLPRWGADDSGLRCCGGGFHQPGPSSGRSLQGFLEDFPRRPEVQAAFAAGDAGIDQFPGEDRVVDFGEGHEDIGEAGAL